MQRILEAHPEAYILGTTATPIRYLDDSRDMSDELFDNAVGEDLSLAQAIVRNILPAPDYVAALYTLDEEINDLMETLKQSKKPEAEKNEIEAQINKAKIDWEKTSGISEILKKHLTAQTNKFIIFCKDKKHLDKMEWVVESWFQKAGLYKRRKKYRVISEDQENDQNLKDFKAAKSQDTAHLLFAIDMLNEGLHIPDVGAVILLRPTESPIIFYQQIGRCIQVGAEHIPIIFDFVNNFQSIRANDFLKDLKEAEKQEARQRAEVGLEEYAPKFRIVDETKKILELFERISERLQPWEVMFEQLKAYTAKHGNCNVPKRDKENMQLSMWVVTQRRRRAKNSLSTENIAKLDSIGFDWNPFDNAWNQMFEKLKAYSEKHGNCNVPQHWKENRQLGKWISNQRTQKDNLPSDKIYQLDSIGFAWDYQGTKWNQMFEKLKCYSEKHGNCNVSSRSKKNIILAAWVAHHRRKMILSTISPERIAKLNSLGFEWKRVKK